MENKLANLDVTAVILTYNEQKHLRRCISNVRKVASSVVVVDSFSTDETVRIAEELGAVVLQHPYVNQAQQFNWALGQLACKQGDWVLRLDADETLTEELIAQITTRLPGLGSEIAGVYWGRRMTFQGRLIRHGGVFPAQVLRLFRYGSGMSENRWMDEHIKVEGATTKFDGEMIDDNLNTLTWWTSKHNDYASREAVELLNLEFGFMERDSIGGLSASTPAAKKRWLKERVYATLPGGARALAYFLYRYVFRLGFLDGPGGAAFHVLQGFWYRYLVDAKVAEVKRYVRDHGVSVQLGIEQVLGIRVAQS